MVFETIEQIKEYLSGDRLVCLECYKSYKSLGQHTGAKHGMNAEQYKEKYGIPKSFPLYSSDVINHLSKKGIERTDVPEYRSLLISRLKPFSGTNGASKGRKMTLAEKNRLRAMSFHQEIPKSVIEGLLDEMEKRRIPLRDFAEEIGYSRANIYSMCKKHNLQDRLKSLWSKLTIQQCAEGHKTSPYLYKEILKLRNELYTQTEIAIILGLSNQAISRCVIKQRKIIRGKHED